MVYTNAAVDLPVVMSRKMRCHTLPVSQRRLVSPEGTVDNGEASRSREPISYLVVQDSF
jgi:hypothetical protein